MPSFRISNKNSFGISVVSGGTIDITVHEVQRHGKLRELYKATGGAWGGTTIDKAFLQFLEEIVGPEVMRKFRAENQDDYIELMREFEVKKRTIEPTLDSKITFKIPISLHELFRNVKDQELRDAVRGNPQFSGKVAFAGDKMRTEPTLVKGLFEETNRTIIEHLRSIFANPVAKEASTILMVGGFSESPMLRAAVQTDFPDKRVIIPHEAGLAVLKGAVIFGHNSNEITSRIAKFSYGLKCWATYEPCRHPENRMVMKDGRPQVRGTFAKLVEIGQSVSPTEPTKPKPFNPVKGTDSFCIKLYASPKPDPIFIDEEDCISIGEVSVNCRDAYGRISGASVSLVFGGTELEVIAVHDTTRRQTSAKFNLVE